MVRRLEGEEKGKIRWLRRLEGDDSIAGESIKPHEKISQLLEISMVGKRAGKVRFALPRVDGAPLLRN